MYVITIAVLFNSIRPLWVTSARELLSISSFITKKFVDKSLSLTIELSYKVIWETPDNIKFFEISAPNYN